MKELQDKLLAIQSELKAPKNAYNSFGKYNYRSQEDILEALKPLLKKHGVLLTLKDEIKQIGQSSTLEEKQENKASHSVPVFYVESTATLTDGQETISTTAQAGIAERKGMDIAQAFGASSSYARKYALGGLFLIDDVKDADATNDHKVVANKNVSANAPSIDDDKPWLNIGTPNFDAVVDAIASGVRTMNDARKKYKISKATQTAIEDAVMAAK